MRILVTNDDGVHSPGLHALKTALDAVGDVVVVAPDGERSAMARSITIRQPLSVERVRLTDGTTAFATDGTPVDCVRLSVLGLTGPPPDVVVSGINLGVNLGDDVTYSATVAAALEGMLLGLPAIALSADVLGAAGGMTPPGAIDESTFDFRASAATAASLVPIVVAPSFPRHVVLCVNAPAGAPDEVRGVRVTRLGRRVYNDTLRFDSVDADGRERYWIYSEGGHTHAGEPDTDISAVEEGFIAITPIHFDLTDLGGMTALERWNLERLHLERVAGADV